MNAPLTTHPRFNRIARVALCLAVAAAAPLSAAGCRNTFEGTIEGMGTGAAAGLYLFANSGGVYHSGDDFVAVGLGTAAVGGILGGVVGFIHGFFMDVADFFSWLSGGGDDDEPERTTVKRVRN